MIHSCGEVPLKSSLKAIFHRAVVVFCWIFFESLLSHSCKGATLKSFLKRLLSLSFDGVPLICSLKTIRRAG